jgi:hypothetical protein
MVNHIIYQQRKMRSLTALGTRIHPPFALEALLEVSVVFANAMHFTLMRIAAAIILGQEGGREDREEDEESL